MIVSEHCGQLRHGAAGSAGPLEHIRQSSRPGHNIVSRNNHSFTQVDKLRFADASKSYLVIIYDLFEESRFPPHGFCPGSRE